ncbi:hypothetical protein [Bradyrhizobium sp. CCBAU 53421]|uniref:hypothetical protein n=1 Tax=Bradyrhizobium sp. CCBAU 53421 TaxID=1325120 RepID=UPI00188D5166|nr:hypothetical protein [Bradyrhizobium sp. CCBAU 53421]QOZ33761.1 hypothetical protein XH92_20575 [Bradyrhizobium sp. CCBAU 53421]
MRTITTVGLLLALVAAAMAPVDARGGHSGGRGHGMHAGGTSHGGGFAADKRHADDLYAKAASDEEDRLLNSKLKSICRGC